MTLFTLGYEGLTSDRFWDVLAHHGVELLIDVRSTPLSRKPGFSKNKLAQAADANGLDYQHWGQLGCPREILTDYRQDKDWALYTERFWKYLRTRDEDIKTLAHLAQRVTCCLVCFEANASFCHRSYVAQYARSFEQSLDTAHISATPLLSYLSLQTNLVARLI